VDHPSCACSANLKWEGQRRIEVVALALMKYEAALKALCAWRQRGVTL